MSAPAGHRAWTWPVFGIALPLVAFLLDVGMQVDPVLWGTTGDPLGNPKVEVGPRQLVVYGLLGASMFGLALAMTTTSRAGRAVALALLLVGTLLSGLHALVFIPLLPLSLVGILMAGIGLLGLTPFAAFAVYLQALSATLGEQAEACPGRGWRWVFLPLLAGVVVIGLVVVPFLRARDVVQRMRKGDPAAVSRAFRELGELAPLARAELAAAYLELGGPAQVRLRNLYLERFDRDVHADLGGRITTDPGGDR